MAVDYCKSLFWTCANGVASSLASGASVAVDYLNQGVEYAGHKLLDYLEHEDGVPVRDRQYHRMPPAEIHARVPHPFRTPARSNSAPLARGTPLADSPQARSVTPPARIQRDESREAPAMSTREVVNLVVEAGEVVGIKKWHMAAVAAVISLLAIGIIVAFAFGFADITKLSGQILLPSIAIPVIGGISYIAYKVRSLMRQF